MVADLVFFVLGLSAGAFCSIVLISLLMAGKQGGAVVGRGRISVDKSFDAI